MYRNPKPYNYASLHFKSQFTHHLHLRLCRDIVALEGEQIDCSFRAYPADA